MVTIILEESDVYYQAQVFDQNNSEPVRFLLTEKSENRLRFENLNHDFPQVIEYYLKNDSVLNAAVSGNINNEYQEIKFNYKKIKQK